MDWHAAIETNRDALKRVLAMLVEMAGLRQSAIASRQSESEPVHAADGPTDCPTDCPLPTADCRSYLPRHLHHAILRLLRPAEAAARRLVIVAALKGPAEAPPPVLRTTSPASQGRIAGDAGTPSILPRLRGRGTAEGGGGGMSIPARLAFRLFDPLPRWRSERRPTPGGVPRLSVPGVTRRLPVPIRRPPGPDDEISAARLGLRLAALSRALDDLPGQARRFARWQARRDAATAVGLHGQRPTEVKRAKRPRFRRIWPLRPGRPPGLPRRPAHEVHDILDVTHGLAFWVLESPDTS